MLCPYCTSTETKVSDKRDTDEGVIRRRRECLRCHKRFTTYERVEQINFTVLKRDGRREAFDAQKLMAGIVKACEKRPLTTERIERMVDEIEAALRCSGDIEVPSRIIGDLVLQKLRDADGVAYLRYASVYRQFDDMNSFKREIEAIAKRNGNSEQHLEVGQ